MLYSLKNSNRFDKEDQAMICGTEEYQEKDSLNDTRKALEGVNHSLWLSELAEDIDLVIPLDTPVFGSKASLEGKFFSQDSLFHKSGLYSLAVDSLAHHLYN